MTAAAPENPRAKGPGTGWGVALVIVGFVLTVVLAFIPTNEAWGVTIAALLVVVAGAFQLGSALIFNRAGRADPSLARSAVRRLVRLAAQASGARERAENSFDAAKNQSSLKTDIGMVGRDLSYIEEGLLSAADDWAEFHPEAFKQIIEEATKARENAVSEAKPSGAQEFGEKS